VADKPTPGRAEIARDANEHILAVQARFHEITLHAFRQDEDPIKLFCECGCMGLVDVTPADYAHKGGAWLEGHGPSGD
jgi:hypothetical protein